MRSLEKRQKGQKKVLSLLLAAKDPDARGRGEPSSSHLLLPENQILNVTRRETGNSVLEEYPDRLKDAQSILMHLTLVISCWHHVFSSLSDLLGNMLHCLPMLGQSQGLNDQSKTGKTYVSL